MNPWGRVDDADAANSWSSVPALWLETVFMSVGARTTLSCALVCSTWRDAAKSEVGQHSINRTCAGVISVSLGALS